MILEPLPHLEYYATIQDKKMQTNYKFVLGKASKKVIFNTFSRGGFRTKKCRQITNLYLGKASKKVIFITFSRGGQRVQIITFFLCLKMIFKQFQTIKFFHVQYLPPEGPSSPPGVPMSVLCSQQPCSAANTLREATNTSCSTADTSCSMADTFFKPSLLGKGSIENNFKKLFLV